MVGVDYGSLQAAMIFCQARDYNLRHRALPPFGQYQITKWYNSESCLRDMLALIYTVCHKNT